MFNQLYDFLHAARSLARARTFTAVCVTSLGVGMSVVIGMLLFMRFFIATPAGVNEDGLAEVVIRPSGALRAQAGRSVIGTWSYADYLDVRDGATGLVLTGWSHGEGLFRLPGGGGAIPLPTMYVSSNYFSNIGITLPRGRGFAPADDASLAPAEAVISHRMWQTRLGSDANVIGRAITVNQTDYVVVGIAPDGFRGHLNDMDVRTQLWLPLSRHPRLAASANARVSRDIDWVQIAARLSPGTSVAQADANVRSLVSGLAERFPASHRDKTGGVEPYFSLGAQMRFIAWRARWILFGVSGMVLLVVCLNISGMMLVRGAMRERELAIRHAIGASRRRLMQYHLSEALVLAVLGGSFASVLLFGVPPAVAWAFNLWGPELDLFKPDMWLVLQCIGLCFVTSLVLGLLPAMRFSRPSILSALRNDSPGSRRVGRLQRLTAAAQAGIAVPFLVFGLIKLDQARVTAMADLGFKPHGLYAARLNLSSIGRTEDDRLRFVSKVQENLAQAPGIVSVVMADGLPLDFNNRFTRVARENDAAFVSAHTTRIGAGYLETVGIRVLGGRAIDANDRAGAERVVMLSEPLARELFPTGDPVGGRVVFTLEGSERATYTVVGVTADLVSTQMESSREQLFVPLAQHPASSVLAIARGASASDPSVRRTFEKVIVDADPDFPFSNFFTGEGQIDHSRADFVTTSAVGAAMAGVALVLAALGVYGVIAFMVTTRTREIGVRVALGASRGRVLRDVLGGALMLVVPGIGVGLVLSVFWVRVVDPSWYPLGGVEPLVYSLAAATAFAVAVLAGLPSARRAAAVQPIVAIRSE